MTNKILSFLLDRSSPSPLKRDSGRLRVPFVEKGINHLAGVIKTGYAHSEFFPKNGFFQKIDPRIKIFFLIFFILIVTLRKDLTSELYVSIFVFILVLLSRLKVFTFYRRVLLFGFFFGFLIAFPSAFNFVTKGEMILPVATLSRPYDFWIYHVPATIGITKEGMFGVAMLTMRVINSLSLSFLVLYTTPFPEMMRALKVLKVPDTFLIIITLCYKYIFIFSKTIEDMYLAKRARMLREDDNKKAREWIAGRLALIFRKTQLRCEEVFRAMVGRGFSDSIKLYGFEKMRAMDWASGAILFSVGLLFLLM
ncbi:MAG: cobalt ECF transporter T component CbiQ [Thermodesulfobacteriota bacterium]